MIWVMFEMAQSLWSSLDFNHHCWSIVLIIITINDMMVNARHLSSSISTPIDQHDQTMQECTLENFQQCISGLWSSSGGNNGDLAFPTTAQQLQLTCTDLKKRVGCLDRHSERCFTNEMMQVFGHIVTNAKQFVHDLCDDRKVQAEYLIHAKCFRNISLDEHKCAHEYRDAIELPPLSLQNPHQQQRREIQMKEIIMRRSCCALQELVLCKRRHVREQCGQSASIFMRDHLPRITNPVLEQHCQAYTYGPGTCDEALYGIRGRMIDMSNDDHQHDNHQDHQNTFRINPSESTGNTIILQRHLKLKQQNQMMKTTQSNLESSSGTMMANWNWLEYNLFITLIVLILIDHLN